MDFDNVLSGLFAELVPDEATRIANAGSLPDARGNPYHDKLGKFAPKNAAGPGQGELFQVGDDSALKTVDSEVASIRAEVEGHTAEDTQNLSYGSMGSVERVQMDDGVSLIHKKQNGESAEDDYEIGSFRDRFGVTPKEANDAEELAPYVSEVFGAGAPAVWRSGKYAQWQQVAPGTMAGYMSEHDYRSALNSESGRRIAMFDAVTNNADRHGGNWLITDDGKPVPIDHGKTFMREGGGSPFVEAHYGETPSKAEATAMLAKFDGLEPKFQALYRETWFREARDRLVNITEGGIHDVGSY